MRKITFRNELVLFIGLIPIVFFLLAVAHVGEDRVTIGERSYINAPSMMNRLLQSTFTAAGLTVVIFYFRRQREGK